MSNDFVKLFCKNIEEVWNPVAGAISRRAQCNSTWKTYFLSCSTLFSWVVCLTIADRLQYCIMSQMLLL